MEQAFDPVDLLAKLGLLQNPLLHDWMGQFEPTLALSRRQERSDEGTASARCVLEAVGSSAGLGLSWTPNVAAQGPRRCSGILSVAPRRNVGVRSKQC
jgi:hypothetical protein